MPRPKYIVTLAFVDGDTGRWVRSTTLKSDYNQVNMIYTLMSKKLQDLSTTDLKELENMSDTADCSGDS